MNERLSARRGADLEVAPKIGSEPMRGGPRQMTKTHKQARRPAFDRVVLLLQGGGALGAYQAGVYEALAEAEIHPDWVAGISIGAINAAIIAGNPPKLRVEQLRKFWEGVTNLVSTPSAGGLGSLLRERRFARGFINQMNAFVALMDGASGFFRPRFPNPFFQFARRGRGDELLRYGAAQGDARIADRFRPGERRTGRNPPQSRRRQRAKRQLWSISTRRAKSSRRSM